VASPGQVAAADRAEPVNTTVIPSMVVLPFQNLSGDPEQEYFADGVVEDLTTALSKFKSFAVVSRNSAFVYKGRAVDVRQIARELGVRYVLEGSVKRGGQRLRFTAQLIDGVSGAHLWADHLDGTIEDVFDFQDRLTESVVSIIEPQIRVAEIERSRRERPESIAAYDLYLRALAKIYTFHEEDNATACALLDDALRLEPDNGVFLGTAAWALEHRNSMGWSPIGPDDRERCMELARRGLVQANGDAAVMAHCGLTLLHGREYDIAFGTVERAVQTNPNTCSLSCAPLSVTSRRWHRPGIDLPAPCAQAQPRRPDQGWALTAIAHAEIVRDNYAEAARWAERSLSVDGHFGPTHWMPISANAHLGRMDDARRFLSRYRRIAPGVTVASIRAGQPALHPDRIEPILDGLRLAGLEEGGSAHA
jgi:adenylate cyclase